MNKPKELKNKHKDPNRTGRFWHGIEIKEATDPLRIIVTEEDVKGAKKKDWSECVFAKACKRLYGSTRVAFFRSVAYVELKDEEGTPYIERYVMPKLMRQQIEAFDKTGKMPEGGFRLKPVNPAYRLDSKSAKSRRERKFQTKDGKARRPELRETAIVGETKKLHETAYMPKILSWRLGTGQVHFGAKEPVLKAH